MGFAELLLIAVGLSMDAFAVSVCKGLSLKKLEAQHAVLVGLYFGGFQALMPVIGWALGYRFMRVIESVDHWIAFGLLTVIGLSMIREARQNEELSDDLIHSIAKSLDGYNRSRDFQKATMQALTDSYRKLYDQLMPEGQKRLTNQQAPQDRDSAGPEAEEDLYTAALMNKFDEMTRFLDRFM